MEFDSDFDLKYIGSELNVNTLKEYEVERIRKVSKFVYDTTGKSLLEFITDNDDWVYDTDFIRGVFTGFESAESRIDFGSVWNINFIKDHRNNNEFFRNLMLGWVVEDVTRYILKENGVNVSLFESAKVKRVVNKIPKQLPDLVLTGSNGSKVYLEVVQTYMSEFRMRRVLRLRMKKYEKLVRYNSYVIVYDFSSDDVKVSLFNIIDGVDSTEFIVNAIVGKPGYVVEVSSGIQCHMCTVDEAVEYIKGLV